MDFRKQVVDISAWVSGGIDRERTQSAAAVDAALCETTIVQLTGHDIPRSVFDNLATATDALFGLDERGKAALRAPAGHNRGYGAPGAEAIGASLGLSDSVRDDFETFSIGAESGDYPRSRPPGLPYAPSVWPEIPEFRRHIDTYFNEVGRVTRTLMSILGDGLGVGRTYFNSITDHSVDTMRLLRYSGRESSGMSAHTDYGFTTLVWGASAPGLQVAHEGRWHDVVAEDGALLLFVGDLLARVTNERWLPTLHRVVPTGRSRTSVVFFHDGNAEAEIAALPALVPPGEQPAYPPVNAARHIAAKLAATRTGVPFSAGYRDAARLPKD